MEIPGFTLTERSFQKQVENYARLMGWKFRHDSATNAPRRCRGCGTVASVQRNAAGMPDLILIRRPRIVWAELKSERGKLTPEQDEMIQDLRACGQEAHVWKPSMWKLIERVLA